jgi:L-ascorbate metabolism protein UlaG (beta-lactamase superfamily)
MTTYQNLDGSAPRKSIGDLLKWRFNRPQRTATFATPRRENDGSALGQTDHAHLTWIGHATFVQRLGGKVLATDPIWSSRIHTIPRLCEPGVALEACPPIDVVTVSHAHYDHLDLPTLKRIGPEAIYVVPKDNAEVLRRAGLPNVVELEWWGSHRVGDLTITLVPAQHWSMRMPWDRNKRLWGGFVYAGPEGTSYHAGDTAFSESLFRAIAERFPKIDWAMIPIGAYEPVWFMKDQHIGPEDAGRAFELLRARTFVAMHWGTFSLTDEPLGEPPERIRSWFRDRGIDDARLWVMDVGETRALQQTAA